MNPNEIRRIVVPVDFAPRCAEALQRALELVDGDHRKLIVVHVLAPLDPMMYGVTFGTVTDESRVEHAASALRTWLEGQGIEQGHCQTRIGNPGVEIPAVAKESNADLVVMPSRRRHFLGLGSVARRVVHNMQTPVLVLRGKHAHSAGNGWKVGKVVVGYDFSSTATSALEAAVAIAQRPSDVHLAHSLRTVDPGYPPLIWPAADDDGRRNFAYTQLQKRTRDAGNEGVVLHVGMGSPGKRLPALAEELDADLIIVGHVGRDGVGRLLGSVAENVVASSPCPVLVVRED
jgi:nucleotide-binding universal stress UspA family protein